MYFLYGRGLLTIMIMISMEPRGGRRKYSDCGPNTRTNNQGKHKAIFTKLWDGGIVTERKSNYYNTYNSSTIKILHLLFLSV